MTTAAYTRYELLRSDPQPARDHLLARVSGDPLPGDRRSQPPRVGLLGTGISMPLYFMVGLAAFATMNAMLASGGRIAADRAAGWNRQLRVSPLPPSAYIGTKVLTGYLLALLCISSCTPAGWRSE